MLLGRDGEGASLLMHAAQRGETDVFRSVLDFLADKLTPNEARPSFFFLNQFFFVVVIHIAFSFGLEVLFIYYTMYTLLSRRYEERSF